MVRSGRPDGTDGQQSLGDLVALAAKDISSLLRYEISLAKSELKLDARRIGIAAALAVVGLFVACLLVVLLCFAYAYGLVAAFGMLWAAFLSCRRYLSGAHRRGRPIRVREDPPGDRHEDDAEDRDGRYRHAAQGRRQPERLGTASRIRKTAP